MDARPGPIARSVPALPNFRRRRVRAAGRRRGCRAPPVQPSRARHRNGTAPAGGSVRSCAGTPSSRNRLSKWPGVITPRITAPSLSTRNVCGTPRGMYTVVPGPAVSSRSSIQNVTAPGQHGLHRHRSVIGERRAHEADVDGPGPQTGGRIDHAVVAHGKVDVGASLAGGRPVETRQGAYAGDGA